ncbi:hypothetical protein SB724_20525, partial [Bacillus sp. SIMBA_031]
MNTIVQSAAFAADADVDSAQAGTRSAEPAFAVCVTTMNRTETLAACLDNLARCVPAAARIVVSD